MIVAGEHEHAPVLRGAGKVRVLEHVAAAIDAGTLAVPHGKYAVDVCTLVQVDLLRPPYRCRGEVFVEAGLELDVRAVEKLLRFPQRLVEAAERRAAIAGHETAGLEARLRVALPLQDQESHERLDPGEKDTAGSELELVVEGNVAQGRRGYRAGNGHREKLQE